ncbi:hypothetical protein [Actinomadura oligospora]|uniref:hypothetical protein n=1 Tax=Actinomadura oligospora TaxID=111804 RepID=UPI00047C54CF|nr:hypothetical protein [Actinomadura oligospora]
MSVLHAYYYGGIGLFEERQDPEDTAVSPALQALIDARIVDLAHGIDFDYRTGGFTLELIGPWSGSDYSGDDVNESNQRSLARDYSDLLINSTQGWAHYGYGLQIDPDFGLDVETAEQAMDLVQVLMGLRHEYPIYDEEDHGKLLDERAEKAWDSWLRGDTESEIYKLTGLDVDLDEMEDAFWELMWEHDIYREAEGHRDVTFPGVWDESFLLALASRGVELRCVDRDEVEDLTDAGYALLGAWQNATYEWPLKGQMTVFDAL